MDLDNQIMDADCGEIYIPVCYRKEYGLEEGQLVQIGEASFTIAGFLRDSQMNSMMASSKRFLVNKADYERLKPSGSEEYLIEFLLEDGADVGQFSADYADAGLPSNGSVITRSYVWSRTCRHLKKIKEEENND